MLLVALFSGLSLTAASALAAPHAPERATLARRDNGINPPSGLGNSASVGWYGTDAEKGSWTGISAEIQLPSIDSAVDGGNNSISAWVQIGGSGTCKDKLLAAGIDMTTAAGDPSHTVYQAWYYQPDSNKQPIDNNGSDINVASASRLSFLSNDSVIFSLDGTHLNITNRRSNNSFTHELPFTNLNASSCTQDASMHVGRTDQSDPGLLFGDDHSLYFTDVKAKYHAHDEDITIEIGLNGQPLSKTTSVSSGSLPGYVGNYTLPSADVKTECMMDTPTEAMCMQQLTRGTPGHVRA